MQYIVKLFPEITIKSPPVRKRLTRQVRDNLRKLLKPLDNDIYIQRDWEKLDIQVPAQSAHLSGEIENILATTPGIGKFSRVRSGTFATIEDICQQAVPEWRDKITHKTFCVRVKRVGKHDFRSMDVERQLGGALLVASDGAKVQLKTPDVVVALEIRDNQYFLLEETLPGLGGYPMGSQDAVLSLISGGFDSTVASYMAIKRGLLTHYCFFNLGGRAHELGVKEVSTYLWRKYAASHRVKFVSVPFEAVVTEILTRVENAYMGVVLKRMMMRAANQVAQKLGLQVLVTGESVAQVSSQTLANLAVIDEASRLLTLRPLAMMDKGQIIDIARDIGTEDFAANMPEYCGVISVKPTTRAKLDRVHRAEQDFDFAVLDNAVATAVVENIDQLLLEAPQQQDSVAIYQSPQPGATIIDIRHPDEIARHALPAGNSKTVEIPFFLLDKQVPELDAGTQYLLYCDRGVMSRLHAELLREKGFDNIGVYRPG